MTAPMPISEVSTPVRIHNALWRCYDEKVNQQIKINDHYYVVRYHNTNSTHAARVEIDGQIWESQNMKKVSPNTEAIEDDPSIRISWSFYHNGNSINWLTKVQSKDKDNHRHIEIYNLRMRPNEKVEEYDMVIAP